MDRRTSIDLALFAVLGLAAAFAWPDSLRQPASPAPPGITFVLGACALTLGLVAVAVAWRAAAWGPALLAAGSLALCASLASRALLTAPGAGIGLARDHPAIDPALLGHLLGGILLGLSARAWPLTRTSPPRDIRFTLLALAVTVVALPFVAPLVPPASQPDGLLRAAVAIAAAGYGWAALRFFGAYRYLRLPPQFALATGSLLLFATTPGVLHGPVPGVPAWEFDLLILAGSVLPALGLLAEQRARPGLRTMALAPSLLRALADLRRGSVESVVALGDVIGGSRGHAARVAAFSVRVGMRLRLNASHLDELATAAHVHDIGKILMPRTLLDGCTALTPEEFAVLRTHPAAGEEIIRRCPGISGAARAIGELHERWDGAGYPLGKAGAQISLTGRILAVVDEFDALATDAPGPAAAAQARALADLQQRAGIQFDPRIVEELARVLDLQALSREHHRPAA